MELAWSSQSFSPPCCVHSEAWGCPGCLHPSKKRGKLQTRSCTPQPFPSGPVSSTAPSVKARVWGTIKGTGGWAPGPVGHPCSVLSAPMSSWLSLPLRFYLLVGSRGRTPGWSSTGDLPFGNPVSRWSLPGREQALDLRAPLPRSQESHSRSPKSFCCILFD